MVTLACPMSFKHYPMDQQTCRIELQSFGYSNKEVNYTWMRKPILKPGINLDNYNVRIRHYSFHYKVGFSQKNTLLAKKRGQGLRRVAVF